MHFERLPSNGQTMQLPKHSVEMTEEGRLALHALAAESPGESIVVSIRGKEGDDWSMSVKGHPEIVGHLTQPPTITKSGAHISTRLSTGEGDYNHLFFASMGPMEVLQQRDTLLQFFSDPIACERIAREAVDQGAYANELSPDPVAGIAQQLLHMRQTVSRSELVLWRNDIFEAATRQSGVFRDALVETDWVPTVPQLWFFEHGSIGICSPGLMRSVKLDKPHVLHGAIVASTQHLYPTKSTETFFAVMAIFVPVAPNFDGSPLLPVLRYAEAPIGKRLAHHLSTDLILDIIAASEFLKTKVVAKQPQQIPRAERRRLARERPPVHVPLIHVVVLRRSQPRRPQPGEEPRPVDWQHQWLVDGHWRNQWYPSEGRHKPIYIEQFVKGPPDKPLLVRPTVHVARR